MLIDERTPLECIGLAKKQLNPLTFYPCPDPGEGGCVGNKCPKCAAHEALALLDRAENKLLAVRAGV